MKFIHLVTSILLTISLGSFGQVRYVNPSTGTNSATCGTSTAPCQTIQYTINNRATNGDTVFLKSGTYSLTGTTRNPIVDLKEDVSLTFIGDTVGSGAILDGSGRRRAFLYAYYGGCAFAHSPANSIAKTTVLNFYNLIVQNCRENELKCGSTYYANGGAIYIMSSPLDSMIVNINNCKFDSNSVRDVSTANNKGRSSAGGAIHFDGRIHYSTNTAKWGEINIENCVFNKNYAIQSDNGGHGGAVSVIYTHKSTINNSLFCSNYVYTINADNGDLRQDRNAGGAVLYYDVIKGPKHLHYIDSCLFIGNSATAKKAASYTNKSEGGAVFLTRGDLLSKSSSATLRISNSEFYDNQIDPGIEHVDVNSGTLDTTSIGNNTFKSNFLFSLGKDTSVCAGDSVTFSLNYTNAEYEWSDSSTKSSSTFIGPDTVWVKLKFASCTYTDTVIIKTKTGSVNLGPDTSACSGDTIVLKPVNSSSVVIWDNGDTSLTRKVFQQGKYWAFRNTGCTGSDSIVVNFNLTDSISLGNDTTICMGDTIILKPLNSTNVVTWDNNLSSNSRKVFLSGKYWAVKKTGNCVGSDTIQINVTNHNSFSLGKDTVGCVGDSITLKPIFLSNAVIWDNNDSSNSRKVHQKGKYWAYTKTGNCINSDTINIDFTPYFPFELGNDTTICSGDSISLGPNHATLKVTWDNAMVSNKRKVFLKGLYWAYNKSGNCLSSDSITVNTIKNKPVSLGNDTSVCDSTSIELKSSAIHSSYLWQNGYLGRTFTASRPGKYFLTGDSICSSSDSIEITWISPLRPNLGSDTIICSGDRIKLHTRINANSLSGRTIKWNGKPGNKEMYVDQEGLYTVEIIGICGTQTDQIQVTIRSLPSLGTINDTVVCGEAIEFDFSQASYTFLWPDGSEQKNQKIEKPGNYKLEFWDDLGCYNTADFKISECPSRFWIPTAFSPNNNGTNDKFFIYGYGISDFEIEIYDRWNKTVYSSKFIDETWDGTVNNEGENPCSVGHYVWKIKYRDNYTHREQVITGGLNLIR